MPLVEYETQIDRRFAGSPLDAATYERVQRLAASCIAGATSVSVTGWIDATVGTVIVIDPYTIQAEARRVTAITGTENKVLAFSGGLTYAHAEDDRVLVLPDNQLSVVWFGAAGDNTTDDLAAFQRTAAGVSAIGGGIMRVPVGTYALRVDIAGGKYITVPANCHIIMYGATLNCTVVDAGVTYYVFRISGSTTTNVQMSGGTVNLDRTSASLAGNNGIGVRIDNQASDVTISDMIINDAELDAIYVGGSTACERITIRNCRLNNSRRNNLSITNCIGAWVENCEFDSANGVSPQAGVDVEPNEGESVSDVSFVGCTARDNVGSGIYIHSGAGQRTAGVAAVRQVTVSGCTFNNNGYNLNFGTVNDCAAVGNILYGTSLGANLIIANAIGCAVTGNVVSAGASRGIYGEGLINCTIADNVVRGNTADGIYLRGRPSGALPNTDYWAVESCTVTGNASYSNGWIGLYCSDLVNGTVTGNNTGSNGQHGFYFINSRHSRISGNMSAGDGTSANATYAAYFFDNADYNAVHGNTARHSDRYFTGTATAGGADTVTLPSGSSSLENFYDDQEIAILSGTGSGQTRTVASYAYATRIITVSVAWTTPPDNTSVVEIRNPNRLLYGIRFNGSSDSNWYLNNDMRLAAAISNAGSGNVTTAGNLE